MNAQRKATKKAKKVIIPPDQKRALSDYRCACRKIAALFLSVGNRHRAESVLEQMGQVTEAFNDVRSAPNVG